MTSNSKYFNMQIFRNSKEMHCNFSNIFMLTSKNLKLPTSIKKDLSKENKTIKNIFFLILSNKAEKCFGVRFDRLSLCLSVRLSVCPRSNSHKYSSNILKLIYVIHI